MAAHYAFNNAEVAIAALLETAALEGDAPEAANAHPGAWMGGSGAVRIPVRVRAAEEAR